MNNNTTTIEIRNLTTGYKLKKGEKIIARGLNASLHQGELTCLLGPNGAGKSTLLRTLSAFQPALGGEINVMGKKLSEYKDTELAKIVSVVLTDNSKINNLTVFEVIALGRSPYTGFWGKLQDTDKKIIEKCLGWLGIEDFADRKMQTLSDGERQKVMIAKAIAQETPIIFLDEPTAFLDYPSKVQMMLLLHRLAKALKKTIFLSTHDLEHALQVADNVWLLDKEKGLATGLPEDLSLEGKIEEYFNREGITFDRETCFFTIGHETAREVAVEGNHDSLEYKLCCKALIRSGIQPIEDKDAVVSIRVPGDGTFRLIEHDKETYKVNKIEHLLHTIVPAIVKQQIAEIRQAAEMNPYE